MKKTILIIYTILFYSNIEAKELSLVEVTAIRANCELALKNNKIDSALTYLKRIAESQKYVNGVDYTLLSRCYLMRNDTIEFKNNINQGILNGMDSSLIKRYFFVYYQGLKKSDSSYLLNYLDLEYNNQYTLYKKNIDTNWLNYLDQILYLDQFVRQQRIKDDSNSTTLWNFCREADSINFVRVKKLIDKNIFPDFHNLGIKSSDFSVILMHISDYDETRWNFIYDYLKQNVQKGGILPKTVRAIVYRRERKNSCSYYGDNKNKDRVLCNCEKVDEYRAEIGLNTLEEEFRNLNYTLPECYKVKHR